MIQLASDTFDASAAAPGTLPTRINRSFGDRVYAWLDRAAPAAYVETAIAQRALEGGDWLQAQTAALKLPPSGQRDELLAQVASARGDRVLAREYYLAAPDPAAFGRLTAQEAQRDPRVAYALERTMTDRLAALGAHPDAVADARWRMGQYAELQAARESAAGARRWREQGLADFRSAAQLAPFSNKYALATANQALELGDAGQAETWFTAAVSANPASADAIAGLGIVALRRGERAAALTQLARAQRIDPNAGMVGALERALHVR